MTNRIFLGMVGRTLYKTHRLATLSDEIVFISRKILFAIIFALTNLGWYGSMYILMNREKG